MTSESRILAECRLAASECGVILHRNNSGAFKNEHGHFVRFGVGQPGGSDLLGWKSITITPEMVGQKIAVFSAAEVKPPKWKPPKSGKAKKRYDEQLNFINQVKIAGGYAGFVCSKEDIYHLFGEIND